MQLTQDVLPFTLAEYYTGARQWADAQLAARGGRPTDKASASGLGDCARKQVADMRRTPTTNPATPDSVMTTEQGTAIEEVCIGAIRTLNDGMYDVVRGISLPEDYPVSGHPDGELRRTLAI